MKTPGDFRYRGRIPASKSILNRLLILQSFEPGITIDGDSDADDVVKMKTALAQLMRGDPADCGAAGTTLRFLALRASRIPGTHHLSGSMRLFERPQNEIARILQQLDCSAEFGPQRLTIRGGGWGVPANGVVIDRSISSQFASALLLSAWDLPADLRLKFEGEAVSESYFTMTLELARRAGLQIRQEAADGGFVIPAHSHPRAGKFEAEIDVSSTFAVAALAVARGGSAEFEAWPEQSLQPDRVFPEILRDMGITVERTIEGTTPLLRVLRDPSKALLPIDRDLKDCPDLFPVLSVLCALAPGRSRLHGAPHLAHKESSRIAKSAELIRLMGRKAHVLHDGIEIDGSASVLPRETVTYATDHDHRLAMAASVARAAGLSINIQNPNVVTKSFPSYWAIADAAQ